MSNKTERTAMNLTKIAAKLNAIPNSEMSGTLYEMAVDGKIAMYDGRIAGINHLVFIPRKVANERRDFYKSQLEPNYVPYADSKALKNLILYWNEKAMSHEF